MPYTPCFGVLISASLFRGCVTVLMTCSPSSQVLYLRVMVEVIDLLQNKSHAMVLVVMSESFIRGWSCDSSNAIFTLEPGLMSEGHSRGHRPITWQLSCHVHPLARSVVLPPGDCHLSFRWSTALNARIFGPVYAISNWSWVHDLTLFSVKPHLTQGHEDLSCISN